MMIIYLLAIVTAISLFRYLNSKPEVDFFHSLPLKTEQIFLTRYGLGLVYFFLPFLLNGLISYCIAIVAGFDSIPTFSQFIMEWATLFACFISIYSFFCLGTIVTGNNFMAVFSSFGFSQAPTALILVYYLLCSEFLDHFSESMSIFYQVPQFTNPFASPFLGYVTIWHYLLQGAIVFALTFLCFMKRPTENSANPVALEPFKLIIKGLGVICGGALGGSIFMMTLSENVLNFLMGALVLSVILHIAFEMLFEMDIRAGLRNKHHFLLLYALISCVTLLISMDLTGYDERNEPLDKISSITWEGVTLETQENMEILHQAIENSIHATEYKEEVSTYRSGITVSMKNGTSYHRNYNYLSFTKEQFYQLACSQEYLIKSHHYDLTEEDFVKIEDDIENIESRSNVNSLYINYMESSSKYLTMEELRQVYPLIIAKNHELTPEFLRENTPILSITFRDSQWTNHYIPLYHVHQEALDFLQVPTISLDNKLNLQLVFYDDTWHSTNFYSHDPAFRQVILDEVHMIYDSFSGQNYNNHWSNKDIMQLVEGGTLVGYLTTERYQELVDQWG